MILIIDNYDSFVYSLARYVELSGHVCEVVRNDAITVDEVVNKNPEAIMISPGPCTPQKAGICIELIKRLGSSTPILGVCLGHQCIGEAYGNTTIYSDEPVHGKACEIDHDGQELFAGMPVPMTVGRYHSLVTKPGIHSPLIITARNDDDGSIMAMRHQTHPVYGIQFHPESVLTEGGIKLINNFMTMAKTNKHQTHRQQKAA